MIKTSPNLKISTKTKILTREPYWIFFSLGLFLGTVGSSVWFLFHWGWISQYPGLMHSQWMMMGFAFFFISGFTLTALPKFSKTAPVSHREMGTLIFFMGAYFLLTLLHMYFTGFDFSSYLALKFAFLSLFASHIYFSYLLIKRIWSPHALTVPSPFLMLYFGCGAGIMGSFALLLDQIILLPFFVFQFGKVFLLFGFAPAFILGFGSQMIPMLSGLPIQRKAGKLRMEFIAIGILFYLSLLGMSLHSTSPLFKTMYVFLFLWVSLRHWSLFKFPISKLSSGLLVSQWLFIIGLFGWSFSKGLSLHFLHLAWIGGFSLMILMIATRVTLAHGGYSLEEERSSKVLSFLTGLIVFSALIRFSAGMVPERLYTAHLAYSSIVWIFVVSIWWFRFGKR